MNLQSFQIIETGHSQAWSGDITPTTAGPVADEDEVSDDDNFGSMAKKVSSQLASLSVTNCDVRQAKLDDEVEIIVQEIKDKYKIGSCKDHPSVHCFNHTVTKTHFDVGYRPRALQWAAKIVNFVFHLISNCAKFVS